MHSQHLWYKTPSDLSETSVFFGTRTSQPPTTNKKKMNRYRVSVILLLLSIVFPAIHGLPRQQKSKRPTPIFRKTQGLELPSNATSIRENIVDTFACEGRIYGYYADVENDCQVFHVCLPQDRGSTRWSFICPAETVFNQATFVCTLTDSSIPCEDSERYYSLNEEIGKIEEEEEEEQEEGNELKPEHPTSESTDVEQELPTPITRLSRRGKNRRVVAQTTETLEPEAETSNGVGRTDDDKTKNFIVHPRNKYTTR